MQQAAFDGRMLRPVSGRLRSAINAINGSYQELEGYGAQRSPQKGAGHCLVLGS